MWGGGCVFSCLGFQGGCLRAWDGMAALLAGVGCIMWVICACALENRWTLRLTRLGQVSCESWCLMICLMVGGGLTRCVAVCFPEPGLDLGRTAESCR